MHGETLKNELCTIYGPQVFDVVHSVR